MRIAWIIILIIFYFLYLIPFLGILLHPHFIWEPIIAGFSFFFFIISLFIIIVKYKLNKWLKIYFILLFINIFLVLWFIFWREYLKQFIIKNIKIESFSNEKIYENNLYVWHKIKIKFDWLQNIKYMKYFFSDWRVTKIPKINLSLPYLYSTYYYNSYYNNNTTIDNKTWIITYILYIQGLIKNNNKYCYNIWNILNWNISYHLNNKWYKYEYQYWDDFKKIEWEERKKQINYIDNNWNDLELISLHKWAFFDVFFTFSGERLLKKQLLLEPMEFQKTLKSIPLCTNEDIEYSKSKLENIF
jgi:hypothetical protein